MGPVRVPLKWAAQHVEMIREWERMPLSLFGVKVVRVTFARDLVTVEGTV